MFLVDLPKIVRLTTGSPVMGHSVSRAICKPCTLRWQFQCACVGTSTFRHVFWNSSARKFQAQVSINGRYQYVGLFDDERKAATAADSVLRDADLPMHRLVRSLNFPSESEKTYCEPVQQKRLRHLAVYGCSHKKEARAWAVVRESLANSASVLTFETRKFGEGIRADGMFRPSGDVTDQWVGLQLKSSGKSFGPYNFNKSGGYGGMALVCVALEHNMSWVIPGTIAPRSGLSITPGGKWDSRFRVQCFASAFRDAWSRPDVFHRKSAADLETPVSHLQRIEFRSQMKGRQFFESLGFKVSWPAVQHGQHDMVVDGVRVQDKTSTSSRTNIGSYHLRMSKRCGLGVPHIPYAANDFDALAVYIWDCIECVGFFFIRVSELAKRGYVGGSRKSLTVYPPSSRPSYPASSESKRWQQKFFFDLRRSLSHERIEALQRFLQIARSCGESASVADVEL